MSQGRMVGAWGGRAFRLGAAVGATVAILLLASIDCSDECSRSSDCSDCQQCVRGSCEPIPGCGADADADGGADADSDVGPEVEGEGGGETDVEPEVEGDAEVLEDGGDEGVTCDLPLRLCGDECVDWQTNDLYCGNCETACSAVETCTGGFCVLDCSGAGLACGDECVDQMSDPDNCGGCGDVCTAPQVCAGGDCVDTCPAGTTPCGRACADFQSDIDHCGACDAPCGNLEWCLLGACAATPCAPGDLFCDGSCVASNELNCGACGLDCTATGYACCPDLFADRMTCANTMTDATYCGACSSATSICPAEEVCRDGVCGPP
ncbi:MAG: hypothetical protein HY907_18645 [Deltaproteobacteria bacterium]|nr:hypothetical protein [Deltaproteobacteria bacterium]